MRLLAFTTAALLWSSSCTVAQQAPPAPAPAPAPAAGPARVTSIAGTWKWKQGEELLELTLKQDGTNITGYHTAIGQRGAKADEVSPDSSGEPSIKGVIKGAVATVEFRSGFPDSTGHGTATLTLRNGFLYWQIVKAEGEHYLPKSARLSRGR